MFTVVLFEPQIPPNTGSIARLCGANNVKLDVVGELGFELSDKKLRRAGMLKNKCLTEMDVPFGVTTTSCDFTSLPSMVI